MIKKEIWGSLISQSLEGQIVVCFDAGIVPTSKVLHYGTHPWFILTWKVVDCSGSGAVTGLR